MKANRLKAVKLFAMAFLPLFVLTGCGTQQQAQQTNSNQNQSTTNGQSGTTTIEQPGNSANQPTADTFDVVVANNPTYGKIFVDGKGLTLYTYSKDTKTSSTCYGQCAVVWPPLLVAGLPKISPDLINGKFGVLTRTDGTQQVTFENMPLYHYANDTKPGDTTGQNVGGVWFVYKVGNDDLNTTTSSKTK